MNLKERKIELQREMKWAQVRDSEEELADEQKKVDKIVKKLEEFQTSSNRKEQELEEIEESIR